jgi:NADPH:quinone reductase
MTSTYKAVVLSGKGGLDRLGETELPLVEPKPGELRVAVRATGAGSTDITMRTGYYPYRPPFPFVPGYEVLGTVDAIGEAVTGFRLGQRVCALTVYGGYAQYLTRSAEDFVVVPDGLDDAEVVALILNYVTAYQMVHRSAKLKAGQTALVTGANGGVGTALLELLAVAGVRAIGAVSDKHKTLVTDLGGTPIPSRGTPLGESVRAIVPEGVDASFDVLGGKGTGECIRATKKGGTVVGYGFMATQVNGKPSNALVLRGYVSLFLGTLLSGRKGTFYGITMIYRKDKTPFRQDLPKLFDLLKQGKIKPRIAARLPLLDARRAQEMLSKGGVEGKIVHLSA